MFLHLPADQVVDRHHVGVVHTADVPHRRRQIVRPDDEGVDAVDFEYLVEGVHRVDMLDLDYPPHPPADPVDEIGLRDPSVVKSPERAVASLAGGGILACRHGGAGVVRRADIGEYDPLGAHVDHRLREDFVVPGDPDEGGSASRAGGDEVVLQALDADGGVLHVDPDHVEAGEREGLGQRRCAAEDVCSEEDVASFQFFIDPSEVVHFRPPRRSSRSFFCSMYM